KVEGLVVNDSHVLVLSLGNGKDEYRILVFRKSDKTWHIFPGLSERRPYVRGFGRYLAATEVASKTAKNPQSAGVEKWDSGENGVRPDLRTRLAQMEPHVSMIFPGRLHLYDVDTEQVFSITTNQGDSEVLLDRKSTR